MKRNKELLKIDEGFDNWLKKNHLKDKSMGFKISENWQEIVGNTIYNHTEHVSVRLPKIYLKINNSSLKELLHGDSQLLITKINDYINSDSVKEIIFT